MKPLEKPPEVEEGDDQKASVGAEAPEDVEVLEDTRDLDEDDYEPDA